jgi:molecular chaperone GrpE
VVIIAKKEIQEAVKQAQEQPKEQKQEPQKDPKDKQIEELTNLLKRVQADFENFKKRTEKEKKDFSEYACSEFVKSLLPLMDSFELALKNKTTTEDFVKGVELIYAQFASLLDSFGVRKIEANGKKFDPYRHEVLLQEESDKEEGIILEELQPGYMMKNCVLRHSRVKIAKNGKNNKSNTAQQNTQACK